MLLEACDAGMPLTTEALRLMHDRGREWQIDHPLLIDVARRLVDQVFGSMWASTWSRAPGEDPFPAVPDPMSPRPLPIGDVTARDRAPHSRSAS